MRISHYIKNTLVFLPLFFGGQVFYQEKILKTGLLFISFCVVSSIVYIINDICDLEKDRNHPVKCNRPLASGAVSIKSSIFLIVILFSIAIVCNLLTFDWISSSILLIYLLLNLGYSLSWKNIPILDIAILVSGFILRLVCGAIVTQIALSGWLFLTVLVASMYFALVKRKNEFQKHNLSTRAVLKKYPIEFLDKSSTMCLTMINIFYALWSMERSSLSSKNSSYMLYTTPLVLFITLRYVMVVESDSEGDPIDVLMHDKFLLIMLFIYVAIVSVLLYF